VPVPTVPMPNRPTLIGFMFNFFTAMRPKNSGRDI
jgi:hypothetical protein